VPAAIGLSEETIVFCIAGWKPSASAAINRCLRSVPNFVSSPAGILDSVMESRLLFVVLLSVVVDERQKPRPSLAIPAT